jgi:hypothetical protein
MQARNEFVTINPVYEVFNESSTSVQERKKGEAKWIVPINIFKGLHYSPSNKHMCYGTLAFHCRKMVEDKNYTIYQSWCPTCRNEWEGIHKDGLIGKAHVNYRYKHIPLWRYGLQMGKLIIAKSITPTFYFIHMGRDDVHSIHHKRLMCPTPTCDIDLSLLSCNNHMFR